jgi:hypothetical protein
VSNPLASPFAEFTILPYYGRRRSVIRWRLEVGLTGNVYFYRSETGVGGWEILNPDDPAGTYGEFLDIEVDQDRMTTIPRYRGILDAGGPPDTWLKGPMVSALDTLSRKEYFLTREIMRQEYRNFSGPKGDGLPCYHCIPKTYGIPAANYDPETKQISGPDPIGLDPSEDGYGLPWQGGFVCPVKTWVKLINMNDRLRQDREMSMGLEEEAKVALRMLAHPVPEVGHMIVLPGSDRRYIIENPIKQYFLRGAVPLFWEASAALLPRNDPRQRFLMPEDTFGTPLAVSSGETLLVQTEEGGETQELLV